MYANNLDGDFKDNLTKFYRYTDMQTDMQTVREKRTLRWKDNIGLAESDPEKSRGNQSFRMYAQT